MVHGALLQVAYPPHLIAQVVADASPVRILSTVARASDLRGATGASKVFEMDGPGGDIIARLERKIKPAGHVGPPPAVATEELEARRRAAPQATLDDLAFVVYSSGSTGLPKGISNPHRAPAMSYRWRLRINPYGPGDRVACNVFFVWECVRALLCGGTVVPVPPEVIYDADALLSFLEINAVTEMLFTPSLFNTILTVSTLEDFRYRSLVVKGCFKWISWTSLLLNELVRVCITHSENCSNRSPIPLAVKSSSTLASFDYRPDWGTLLECGTF